MCKLIAKQHIKNNTRFIAIKLMVTEYVAKVQKKCNATKD